MVAAKLMGTVKKLSVLREPPAGVLPAGENCFYNSALSEFKSNVRETWRVILVSEADIFFTESLRILAERLSQSETHLPLR